MDPEKIGKLAIPHLKVLISRTLTDKRASVELAEFTGLTHLYFGF